MKLSKLGEFGLIRRIGKGFPPKSSRVSAGIGDDAAALTLSPSAILLATTDMLLEGVHFDLAFTDFFSLGWKSAAANLSDIAAMGGMPRFCLTALGIPPRVTVEDIGDFYRGFGKLLRAHRTDLVGGDTCRSGKGLVVSVTVLGEVEKRRMLLRSGARPGDRIFVTGTLGDSAAGLEILKGRGKGQGARGRRTHDAAGVKRLIERHLRPEPRMEWGRRIAISGCASAMIDVSDGLSSDLARICEESGVGAELSSERIPLSVALRGFSEQSGKPGLEYALSGGEDYEILFTVPPAKVKRILSLKIPATEIGEITGGRNMVLSDGSGNRRPLVPSGYDHFAPASERVKHEEHPG